MSLIPFILALAFVGLLVWIVLQIPMPQFVKNIIIAVVCFVMVVWVLQQLGVDTGLNKMRIK